jgi:hypothetical protein
MAAQEEVIRDPCGYVTVPPSVVVKVTGTGRNDINGLLGIVVSFNVERERYLVHMTRSQSTMALKKEHLYKASILESYRAQTEQLRNDARVREKMSKYLNLCRKFVAPFKLSHVVGGVLTLFTSLVITVGFLKTIMTTSLIALIAAIASPDASSGPRAVASNFPERARTIIEKQIPILRGKLTNRVAVGVILLLVALCLQSLIQVHSSAKTNPHKPRKSFSNKPVMDKSMLERYYSLGYEDAAKGRQHGSSFASGDLEKVLLVDTEEDVVSQQSMDPDSEDVITEDASEENGKKRTTIFSKLTSMTNIASMIYLYRSIIELGTDQSTSLFSMGQLAANVQHNTEWWRKALLGLSLYNVLRIFV